MKLTLQEKIARRQQRKLHYMANTVTRKLIDADIARGVPPHQISRAAAKDYYNDALALVADIANAGETRRINIPSVATARLKHYYDGDADKP